MDGETKTPRCARCRNHGIISRLKGHKKVCPWKQCACSKCILIYERQKLMAAQIEIRREDENTETRLTFPVSLHTCIQSNSANSIYKARKIQRGKKRVYFWFITPSFNILLFIQRSFHCWNVEKILQIFIILYDGW